MSLQLSFCLVCFATGPQKSNQSYISFQPLPSLIMATKTTLSWKLITFIGGIYYISAEKTKKTNKKPFACFFSQSFNVAAICYSQDHIKAAKTYIYALTIYQLTKKRCISILVISIYYDLRTILILSPHQNLGIQLIIFIK